MLILSLFLSHLSAHFPAFYHFFGCIASLKVTLSVTELLAHVGVLYLFYVETNFSIPLQAFLQAGNPVIFSGTRSLFPEPDHIFQNRGKLSGNRDTFSGDRR